MIQPDDKILIVGAGCFGLSTASHLLHRGFKDITILDKAASLPAADAASYDLNKIVRTSYDDVFYTKLAQEAIAQWKSEEWGDTYHECGVLVLGHSADKHSYSSQSYVNDISIGARVAVVENSAEIRNKGMFPDGVRVASLQNTAGYLNYDGGWANAAQGVELLTNKIRARGGKFVPGKEVYRLVRTPEDGRTRGVECRDGSVFDADLVIIATGAWTASAFPQLQLKEKCLATGQSIATIQLTAEEAEAYRRCPVVLNFSTGFYIFPPTQDNVVKMAMHAAGYTYIPQHDTSSPSNDSGISTPRTISNANENGLLIPKVALTHLRTHLREVYPDLAEKPFLGTRLCWYNDSPDGDWVIGFHPGDPAVMLATAGSGHAYKFLPVIGKLVADAIEGKLDPLLASKFAVDRRHSDVDQSRYGQTVEALHLDSLCTPEDLRP